MLRRGLMILLLALLFEAPLACDAERYFGPYELEVPTSIGESSAARSFDFPLSAEDLRELEDLALCIEQQPDRELPCICDIPILRIDEQKTRIDYRLQNRGDQMLNVLVWVGVDKQANASDPDLLPDLPWIEVLGEHLHRLEPARSADSSFLEEEVRDMELAWAIGRFPACQEAELDLPSPTRLLIGLSLPDEEAKANVALQVVVRVKSGG